MGLSSARGEKANRFNQQPFVLMENLVALCQRHIKVNKNWSAGLKETATQHGCIKILMPSDFQTSITYSMLMRMQNWPWLGHKPSSACKTTLPPTCLWLWRNMHSRRWTEKLWLGSKLPAWELGQLVTGEQRGCVWVPVLTIISRWHWGNGFTSPRLQLSSCALWKYPRRSASCKPWLIPFRFEMKYLNMLLARPAPDLIRISSGWPAPLPPHISDGQREGRTPKQRPSELPSYSNSFMAESYSYPPEKNLRCFLLPTKLMALDLVQNLRVTFKIVSIWLQSLSQLLPSAQTPCSCNLSPSKQVISFHTSAFVSISHLLECFPISSKYLIFPLRPSLNVCSMVSSLPHGTVIMCTYDCLSHRLAVLFSSLVIHVWWVPRVSGWTEWSQRRPQISF